MIEGGWRRMKWMKWMKWNEKKLGREDAGEMERSPKDWLGRAG